MHISFVGTVLVAWGTAATFMGLLIIATGIAAIGIGYYYKKRMSTSEM